MEISIESIHEVDLADGAMLEVELVGVHLPFGDLDVILSLLLGTLDLVPLVTGLYGSLVRRDKRVFSVYHSASYHCLYLLLWQTHHSLS